MTNGPKEERSSIVGRKLPADVADRLVRQLTSWREKLLALDRRQRLLYFKHTKSASLEVLQNGAGGLLDMLDSGDVVIRPQVDADVAIPERSIVVTNKTADTLKIALRRLDQQSQQSYADRGVWTLYLGLGMLRWKDSGDDELVESPILMVPVQLKRTGADSPYVLFRAEEEITVNPALKLKMEEYGLSLPDVDPDSPDIGGLTSEINRLIQGYDGWSTVDRAVCSSFTFHKEAMYRDLQVNSDVVAAHPMVQLLAIGPDAPSAGEFAFDPTPIEHLDRTFPPEQMFSILDADSSQRRCILAATNGRSFVMDGPPGTGKSQTIANMIAELIASGKTVLFVSEKAAALDVVRDRLKSAGLQQFLLELHSHAATRKHVAQELSTALKTRVAAHRTFSAGDEDRLVAIRESLTGYTDALNEVRSPLGLSVFEVLGRLEQLSGHVDASADGGITWSALDARARSQLCEAASRLGNLWHVSERGDDFLWRGLSRRGLGAPEARELKRLAARAAENARDLAVRLDTVDTATGLRLARNSDGVRKRSALLALLEDSNDVPVEWFSRSSLQPVRLRLSEARTAVDNIVSKSNELDRVVGPRWNELDEASLLVLESGLKDSLLDGRMGPTAIEALERQLVEVPVQLAAVQDDAIQLAELLGVPSAGITVARAVELVELASLGGVVERPEGHWLNAALQSQVAESILAMDKMVEHARRRQEAMREYFTPAALEQDLGTLAVRFRDVYKGFGKFSKAARADKKSLKAVTVSGKLDKALIARLEEAASWQEAVQELGSGEQFHAPRLGSAYQGLSTDFDILRVALGNARRAATLAGIEVDPDRLSKQLASGGVPDPALIPIADRLKTGLIQWDKTVAALSGHHGDSVVHSGPIESISEWAIAGVARLTPVRNALVHVSTVAQREVGLYEGVSLIGAARSVRVGLTDLESDAAADPALFGDIGLDLTTDFELVAQQLDWAEAVRRSVGVPISGGVAKRLGYVTVPASELTGIAAKWEQVSAELVSNFSPRRSAELKVDLLEDINGAAELLADMESGAIPDIENWCNYLRDREWMQEKGFGNVLAELEKSPRSPEFVAHSLEYAALEAWVDDVVRIDGRLAGYQADNREALVAGFKSLDQTQVHDARARVVESCNARAPRSINGRPAQVIIREAQKKTRHKPVRQLLDESGSLVQELKPCFMMSPLSVSQYLPTSIKFDVVIFDEASQVLPSDAVNCVYRGNQLIVAGDQKQLPPSSFFSISDDAAGEDEDDEIDVFESVLDIAKGAGGLTSLPLNWHYRSRHEDLITYSNYRFYDGSLHTFPGAVFDAPNLGVELIPVKGTYRRGTTRDNPVEAAKVVERVLYFAQSFPSESIGVVTFSSAQADAVTAELERQSAEHPVLAGLLSDHDRLDGFFVKSLENVQGDERDIIVFSLGYGPDENGKFTMNFGPLNREGGWRRLNVAITRARKRVEVVSSFRASEMSATVNDGLRHLRNYLDFAERGQKALALDLDDGDGDVESVFEEQVVNVIRGWGYDVVPQVGVAGYRIDMAVRHPDRPGQYVIGIECDGAAYHSAKTARDRDRLRESVLRNLGWELHRIWGLSWWRDREVQEKRLRKAIEVAIAESDRPTAPAPIPEVIAQPIAVVEVDFDTKPDWATEYTMVGEPRCLRRDPKTIEGQQDLRAYFVQVVEAEAPVHRDVLYDRFKQAWGIQRLGAVAKRSADSALASANIKGRSVAPRSDGVCRLPDLALSVVRIPGAEQSPRKLVHIPEEELDLAVTHLIDDARLLDADTLAQQVSKLFGWQRVTEENRSVTELSVDRLIGCGDVMRARGGELTLVSE